MKAELLFFQITMWLLSPVYHSGGMLQKWLTVNVSGSHAMCRDFQSSVGPRYLWERKERILLAKKKDLHYNATSSGNLRTFLITEYVPVFQDSLSSVLNPDPHKILSPDQIPSGNVEIEVYESGGASPFPQKIKTSHLILFYCSGNLLLKVKVLVFIWRNLYPDPSRF